MTHRVLIVDDHPIVRRGLRELLAEERDLSVCGEADDVEEAMIKLRELRPDVVVIDLTLRNGHGLELIERIRAEDKRVMMLVSSMHEDSLYAERAVRCGASGYINKNEKPEKIVHAIRDVLRGEIHVSPQIADRLLHRLQGGHPLEEDPIQALTNRELEVFEMIGKGMVVKRIAQQLGLSQKTIEAHREGIKDKLRLKNSHEVTRRATLWIAEGR